MVKPADPIKYREGDPLDPDFWDKTASILKWRKGEPGDEYAIREVWGACVYDRVMRPSERDIVVDAGAHIGAFTVRASQMVGELGKVYAFEPAPENFSYLVLNTKNLKNVQVFQTALWSSEGEATLFIATTHTGSYSLGHSLLDKMWENGPNMKSNGTILVRTSCLDNVISGRVDFMKVDVERSEFEVLKGAKRILKDCKPFIAIEIHTKQLVDQVSSFLLNLGYKHGPPGPVFTFEAN